MKNCYSIAVDGPAGAGKSTVARKVADLLEIEYIDTGAMFRALTLKVLDKNIDPKDDENIISLLENTEIDFQNRNIYLDGENVNEEIRENRISQNVSFISEIEAVRDEMLNIQRNISKEKSVIMDGRDIGTVVLPDADFKFFINATVDERARRRYEELKLRNNKDISYEEIREEIKRRDDIDTNRKIAPLKKAKDAIEIDTTNKNIDEVVDLIITTVRR